MESNERQSYGTDQNIQGTDLDPVYQTQQVGIEQYKLDVPDGVYEVVLHFASLENEGERELLAYNLGSDAQVESMVMQRVFSVTVNRQPIFTNMDMVREYGTQREINRKIIVRSKNNEGITIDFDAIQGNAVLNGVEVKKVY